MNEFDRLDEACRFLGDKLVFVFGSNEAGRHGGGAALTALNDFGAVYGQGIGLQGRSYGIPTKDKRIETLDLHTINNYVEDFKLFAAKHPEKVFFITRIGCGLAGYTDRDISPMFKDCPENCILPEGWGP